MLSEFPELKKKLDDNQSKFVFVGAVIATLGATYLYGKSKGKLTVEVFLYNTNGDLTKLNATPSK